jgi:hypothetical protein
MRNGPYARRHHHVDQVRQIPGAIAQRADARVPFRARRAELAVLACVAVGLGRASALAIAAIGTRPRNIIVPRNAGGGPPPVQARDGSGVVHTRLICRFAGVLMRRLEGWLENLGSTSVFRRKSRAYRNSVQNAVFLFEFRNSNAERSRKAFLRPNKVVPSCALRTLCSRPGGTELLYEVLTSAFLLPPNN